MLVRLLDCLIVGSYFINVPTENKLNDHWLWYLVLPSYWSSNLTIELSVPDMRTLSTY